MAVFHLTSVTFLKNLSYVAQGDYGLCRNSLKQITMNWTGIMKNVRMVIICFHNMSVLWAAAYNVIFSYSLKRILKETEVLWYIAKVDRFMVFLSIYLKHAPEDC